MESTNMVEENTQRQRRATNDVIAGEAHKGHPVQLHMVKLSPGRATNGCTAAWPAAEGSWVPATSSGISTLPRLSSAPR